MNDSCIATSIGLVGIEDPLQNGNIVIIKNIRAGDRTSVYILVDSVPKYGHEHGKRGRFRMRMTVSFLRAIDMAIAAGMYVWPSAQTEDSMYVHEHGYSVDII